MTAPALVEAPAQFKQLGHCRHATPEDRPHFVRLWRAMLEELRERGSFRLPDEHNLYLFWDYFDAYTTGRLGGTVVFWSPTSESDPAGVAMAGSQYHEPIWHLDYNGERWGQLWGVYVEPAYRGTRAGLQMEELGEERLLALGFHQLVTTVQAGNPLGLANQRQLAESREIQVMETVFVGRLGKGPPCEPS